MMLRRRLYCSFLLVGAMQVQGQIPVELFAGHQQATIDMLFFKCFKNKEGTASRWLFFNRNRAAMDYRMTSTQYLPRFGFTEAVSYNHPRWKGVAPVMVVQVSNSGVFPKLGLQYAGQNKSATLFTWLVCEALPKPYVDYFVLFRITPRVSETMRLFLQVESVNAIPTAKAEAFAFTQRLRIGLAKRHAQWGIGADFVSSGRSSFTTNSNSGPFLRYEF